MAVPEKVEYESPAKMSLGVSYVSALKREIILHWISIYPMPLCRIRVLRRVAMWRRVTKSWCVDDGHDFSSFSRKKEQVETVETSKLTNRRLLSVSSALIMIAFYRISVIVVFIVICKCFVFFSNYAH